MCWTSDRCRGEDEEGTESGEIVSRREEEMSDCISE